jgi:hypothetical protein
MLCNAQHVAGHHVAYVAKRSDQQACLGSSLHQNGQLSHQHVPLAKEHVKQSKLECIAC